jgi:phospholipid/cholesterol/gamma-HCH transport system substrate-binding protein
MKSHIRSEAKIGIIVIVAFAVFVWGLNYLKGVNLLKPSNYYHVYYNQIDGLVKSSPVMLDGFQVGLVRDIEYMYDHPGRIRVSLSLNSKLNVPAGSSAVLKSGLLGGPTLELKLGEQTGKFLESGDSLIAIREPGLMDELTGGLLQDIDLLVLRTDSLVSGVETLVSDGNLKSTLNSLQKTSHELEQVSGKLNQTMDNEIPAILGNINTASAELSGIGKKLNQIDFEGTVGRLDRTLDEVGNITLKLNSPDNSMGLLLNDKSLYINLSNTASSANDFLLDLRKSPKRYVHFSIFGNSKKD